MNKKIKVNNIYDGKDLIFVKYEMLTQIGEGSFGKIVSSNIMYIHYNNQ